MIVDKVCPATKKDVRMFVSSLPVSAIKASVVASAWVGGGATGRALRNFREIQMPCLAP